MKGKTAPPAHSIGSLIEQVRDLVQSARRAAIANVNTLQVLTNFEIGRLIVEHVQRGEHRATYGKETLKHLAASLTAEFGRGFSERNLEYMRKFFLAWKERASQISQKPSAKSQPTAPIAQQTASAELIAASIRQNTTLPVHSGQSAAPFTLNWSHYVFLLGIRDESERRFYEIEATQGSWSLPELKRQFNSGLYERLALSGDKKRVRKLAQEGHIVSQPSDLLKDPYVLEFLGLEEKPAYSESDLETAIISKLQSFLLELGKGFLFEARQKRFTFGEDHFFVDLVFYNRLLRCYVLLDLKIGKLTHQDLGQIQMYVNYFDRYVKRDDENPTVGIVLCKKKHDALVEITLPPGANIFAPAYQLYLPSKEDLRERLLAWTRSDSDPESDPGDRL
jgi:predicted nuclease of restriction endonuclease-like (RecB) superfamily